jgi:hypothetical protein
MTHFLGLLSLITNDMIEKNLFNWIFLLDFHLDSQTRPNHLLAVNDEFFKNDRKKTKCKQILIEMDLAAV